MAKFRKKPVVIEAWQVPNPDHTAPMPPRWLIDAVNSGVVIQQPSGDVVVRTLEGDMIGIVGDWIIQGVKGELYPCKPDIFAATYDAA